MIKLHDEFLFMNKDGVRGKGFGGKGLENIVKERDKILLSQKYTFSEYIDEDLGTAGDPQEGILDATAINIMGIQKTQTSERYGADRKGNQSVSTVLNDLAKRINTKIKEETGEIGTETVDSNENVRESPSKNPIIPVYANIQSNKTIVGYKYELDINDFPQYSRYKITSKEVINSLQELFSVSVTIRGVYVHNNIMPIITPAPGVSNANPNILGRRLHLLIESVSERNIILAMNEIANIIKGSLEESSVKL